MSSGIGTRVDTTLHELVDRFDAEPVFWKQLEIAKQIVALGDRRVLPRLEKWLGHQDRHLRGNAALVSAASAMCAALRSSLPS